MPMSNFLADPNNTTLMLGGLTLLVVALVVIALFWRMRSRSRTEAPVQPSPPPSHVEPPVAPPPPPVSLPTEVTLEFTTPAGRLVSFKLDKPALTVGRAPDNDIVILDSIPNADTVSKHHARLRRDQDDYVVRDLGSKNGLTVNGLQTVENLLQDGDRLGFGTAEAIFHRPLAGGPPDKGGPGPGGAA
jgi:predicted component of type VI protein secretion system